MLAAELEQPAGVAGVREEGEADQYATGVLIHATLHPAPWHPLPLDTPRFRATAGDIGPDPEQGEWRGHARGLLAIGDVATGWIALGGLALGALALGGTAGGLVAIGGAAVISAMQQDSAAIEFFSSWAPFLPLP